MTGVQTCALPILGSRAHLFHERRLIGNRKGADRADGVQNQSAQGFGRDIMAAAGGSSFLTGKGIRSEERRVGKECRSRWSPDH